VLMIIIAFILIPLIFIILLLMADSIVSEVKL
jgi:hypothetical protein